MNKARELYADHWLGFSEVQLHQWLEEAGFADIEVTVVSREKEKPAFPDGFCDGSEVTAKAADGREKLGNGERPRVV